MKDSLSVIKFNFLFSLIKKYLQLKIEDTIFKLKIEDKIFLLFY